MIVLTIAGFDPSGRAGVLADVWAINASKGAARAAITALTAQGRRFSSTPVEPSVLRAQIKAVIRDAAAIKVGMVPNRGSLAVIRAELRAGSAPIVIDPVVRSSRGEPLSSLTPRDYLSLGSLGAVITPNRAELHWLGVDAAGLLAAGFSGVVLKGSDGATDEVFSPGRHLVLRGTRLPRSTLHHRGTGCRFGSGMAVALARGEDLFTAASSAKRLVRKFLRAPIIP